MRPATWLLISAAAPTVAGCGRGGSWTAPTDDPNWVLGHNQGMIAGAEQARQDVCNEIRRY